MKPQTINEYIAAAPPAAHGYAARVRAVIKKAAPEAEEKLSYGMPYYGYKGRLIYWGAYNSHIGVYIMDAARQALAAEIKPYHKSKATLHFPLDQPLPEDLLEKIVTTQVRANAANHHK